MSQTQVSRTLVFDAPRHARGFFEALVSDNLDIGRPVTIETVFDRQVRSGRLRGTGGESRPRSSPAASRSPSTPYKHSRIKGVPEGQPGAADRDRDQRSRRPRLATPSAHSRRPASQGGCGQPSLVAG